MALTQQHRSAIYDVWAPQLGEEVTEALIAHFPARDLDEPVTKEFVGIKFAELDVKIADLRTEVHEIRAETRTDIAELRADMHKDSTRLTNEMHMGDSRLTDDITRLSNEMHEGFTRLSNEVNQFALQHTRETNRAIEAIRLELATNQRMLTLWFATIVVSLAGIAVTVALALAR